MSAKIKLHRSRLAIAIDSRASNKSSAVGHHQVLKRTSDELAREERCRGRRSDERVVSHHNSRIVATITKSFAVRRNVESERPGGIVSKTSGL